MAQQQAKRDELSARRREKKAADAAAAIVPDLGDDHDPTVDIDQDLPVGQNNINGHPPHPPLATMSFEDTNGTDPTDVVGKLGQVLLAYNEAEIVKWINRLEIKMETFGVQSQWSKRIILENNLPVSVQDDLDNLLSKRKDKAGEKIYKEVKTLLLKIHGPKPTDDFKLAKSLQMTSTPSQFAKKLRTLVCKKETPLSDCCCGNIVASLWEDGLDPDLRTAVANMDLVSSFDTTCDAADAIWAAIQSTRTRGSKVAAIKPANNQSGEDIAAVRQQASGQKQKKKGNFKRKTRPNPEDKSTWGPPHASGPPPGVCMNHHIYGKEAFFCRQSSKCPWKSHVKPPPEDK